MKDVIQLDRIDLDILEYLSKDARLTNKDLAKKLGIAPSTSFERVRVLRESRVIKGFHAEIDVETLGIDLRAMIAIRLEAYSRRKFNEFYNYIVGLNAVTTVYHLSGANDILVQVVVRNNKELRSLVMDSFADRPEVAQIETSLIYEKTRKYSVPIDTNELLDD